VGFIELKLSGRDIQTLMGTAALSADTRRPAGVLGADGSFMATPEMRRQQLPMIATQQRQSLDERLSRCSASTKTPNHPFHEIRCFAVRLFGLDKTIVCSRVGINGTTSAVELRQIRLIPRADDCPGRLARRRAARARFLTTPVEMCRV
jgi:hypothetical protein